VLITGPKQGAMFATQERREAVRSHAERGNEAPGIAHA